MVTGFVSVSVKETSQRRNQIFKLRSQYFVFKQYGTMTNSVFFLREVQQAYEVLSNENDRLTYNSIHGFGTPKRSSTANNNTYQQKSAYEYAQRHAEYRHAQQNDTFNDGKRNKQRNPYAEEKGFSTE